MVTFFLQSYNIQTTQAKVDQLIENLQDQEIVKVQDVSENLTRFLSKKFDQKNSLDSAAGHFFQWQ